MVEDPARQLADLTASALKANSLTDKQLKQVPILTGLVNYK